MWALKQKELRTVTVADLQRLQAVNAHNVRPVAQTLACVFRGWGVKDPALQALEAADSANKLLQWAARIFRAAEQTVTPERGADLLQALHMMCPESDPVEERVTIGRELASLYDREGAAATPEHWDAVHAVHMRRFDLLPAERRQRVLPVADVPSARGFSAEVLEKMETTRDARAFQADVTACFTTRDAQPSASLFSFLRDPSSTGQGQEPQPRTLPGAAPTQTLTPQVTARPPTDTQYREIPRGSKGTVAIFFNPTCEARYDEVRGLATHMLGAAGEAVTNVRNSISYVARVEEGELPRGLDLPKEYRLPSGINCTVRRAQGAPNVPRAEQRVTGRKRPYADVAETAPPVPPLPRGMPPTIISPEWGVSDARPTRSALPRGPKTGRQ